MLQKSLQTLKIGLRMRYPSLTRIRSLRTNLPVLLTPQLPHKPSNTFHSQQGDDPLVSPRPSDDGSMTVTNEIAIKVERSDLEDFSRKIELKLPVIDKTAYLYKLLDQRNTVFVMGPEGFGKTFNLSTLQAIFQNGKTWWETHCSNLSIVKDFHYEFPQHPVLYLDFNKVRGLFGLEYYISKTLKSQIERASLQQELALKITKYEECKSSQALLDLFQETIIKLSRKYQKGVVILIDEYQRPLTSLALLSQAQKIENLMNHQDIIEMNNFLKRLLEIIKRLRDQSHDQVNYIRFECITGLAPMNTFTSFSAFSDVFHVLRNEGFNGIIGYTETEILENFGENLEEMARKEFTRRERNKADDPNTPNEASQEKLKKIRKEIENDLRKNYHGLRLSYDQEHPLYCPQVINALFDNWRTSSSPQFPPFYANSEQSKLIWKVAKMMPMEMKQNFFCALLDETNSQSLFTCSKDQLLMNQSLENLLLKPEETCFFSGVVSVQKNQSSQNLWSLGLANNEMRKALLQELENQMGSPDSVVNLIQQVINGHFRDYLSSIDKRLKLLATFTNISNGECQFEKCAEFYRGTLFTVVHNQLVKFAQDKQIRKKFGIKNFGFIPEKGEGSSTKPEFVMYFEVEKNKQIEKKVLVLSEFELDEFGECEEFYDIEDFANIDEDSKEAIVEKVQEEFPEKSQIMKEGWSEKCAFLEDYERIWVVTLLQSGQLQHAILFKDGDEKESLIPDVTLHFRQDG